MGRGDKERVDQAAVDAMRPVLASIAMDGVVVIGEGEKDEAPMLYNGERVGNGSPPAVDIAVDPVDGTTLTAKALPDALAVIAVAERGAMFDPGPCVYMEKLAVAGDVVDAVDFEAPIEDNLAIIAGARRKRPEDITVAILDRPRHAELVQRVLSTGARIKFLLDGDVGGAILAADEGSIGRRARRHRRHAGGRDRRVRDEVPGRRDLRQALPAQRRGAPGGARRRLRPRQGPHAPTTWWRATTSSSRPPA